MNKQIENAWALSITFRQLLDQRLFLEIAHGNVNTLMPSEQKRGWVYRSSPKGKENLYKEHLAFCIEKTWTTVTAEADSLSLAQAIASLLVLRMQDIQFHLYKFDIFHTTYKQYEKAVARTSRIGDQINSLFIIPTNEGSLSLCHMTVIGNPEIQVGIIAKEPIELAIKIKQLLSPTHCKTELIPEHDPKEIESRITLQQDSRIILNFYNMNEFT